MRKFTTTLLLVSTLVAGAMAAPLLYAQGGQQPIRLDDGSWDDGGQKHKR